jgi:hypothetical protein
MMMINHPMLLMRDPPPEIDVTRPALPKRTLDGRFYVSSTPTTIEFTTVMDPNSWSVESAAQVPEPAKAGGEEHSVTTPVAADFKAGDRVMVIDSRGDFLPIPRIFNRANRVLFSAYPPDGNPLIDMYCWTHDRWWYRRPTAAELVEHWPEVLP